jgi:hypothetical protein
VGPCGRANLCQPVIGSPSMARRPRGARSRRARRPGGHGPCRHGCSSIGRPGSNRGPRTRRARRPPGQSHDGIERHRHLCGRRLCRDAPSIDDIPELLAPRDHRPQARAGRRRERRRGERTVRGQPRHAGREGVRSGHRAYRLPRRGRAPLRIRTPHGRNEGVGPQGVLPGRHGNPCAGHGRPPHRPTAGGAGSRVLWCGGLEAPRRLRDGHLSRHAGRRVEQLDLSYTPPLSSPWDPVQTSCMEWAAQPSEGRA